jgi:hypothetical protein
MDILQIETEESKVVFEHSTFSQFTKDFQLTFSYLLSILKAKYAFTVTELQSLFFGLFSIQKHQNSFTNSVQLKLL